MRARNPRYIMAKPPPEVQVQVQAQIAALDSFATPPFPLRFDRERPKRE